jgi:hypothetical protein
MTRTLYTGHWPAQGTWNHSVGPMKLYKWALLPNMPTKCILTGHWPAQGTGNRSVGGVSRGQFHKSIPTWFNVCNWPLTCPRDRDPLCWQNPIKPYKWTLLPINMPINWPLMTCSRDWEPLCSCSVGRDSWTLQMSRTPYTGHWSTQGTGNHSVGRDSSIGTASITL